MPRAEDPRVMVRMSKADRAVIDGAARSVGVSTGGLLRECGVRYAAQVARMVESGELRLRRRSSVEPVVEVERPASPARVSVEDAATARAIAFRRATGALP